jgi:Domain of unknown function(DUF2779)
VPPVLPLPMPMSTVRRGLSKSRIMAGLQCPRRLWLIAYRPEQAVWSAGARRRLAVGHSLGEAARRLYAGGELIDEGRGGLRRALALTRARLAQPGDLTLFEPAFERDDTLVRVDVLRRRAGACRTVEVKASATLKAYQVTDAAVQAWVVAGSVRLQAVAVAHVDTSFVYPGGGDYRGLLKEVDISQDARPIVAHMPALAAELRDMLAGPCPDKDVGRHCFAPFPCEFFTDCGPRDADFPVTLLPRGLQLSLELLADGYADLRDVPLERLMQPEHQRIWRATVGGAVVLDPAVAHLLRELPYPRRYFDLEALNPAVPLWAGTRPYQVQPFQFSCHLQARPADERLQHTEFLDTSGADPARAFAEAALAALGTEGPVIVYSGYERAALESLASRLPDLAARLRAVQGRLVDLLPLVQAHYYHPDMRGSWSLKSVLPTIAPELAYDGGLGEVQEGLGTQDAWAALAGLAPEAAGGGEQRRQSLRAALLAYCARDTLAVARLVRFLERSDGAGG